MCENEQKDVEAALRARSGNFLFISWQTTDTEECKKKISEIDSLIKKYTKENEKYENKIAYLEEEIQKIDKEIEELPLFNKKI